MRYLLIRFFSFCIFGLFYRVKVNGLENLPLQGKAILAANHISVLDPMVLFHICPRRFHAITANFLFKIWWLGWAFKATSCIPANNSSKKIISILKKNEIVLFFPEGKCKIKEKDGLQKLYKGVVIVALKTGSSVVPIHIKGTDEAWAKKRKLPRLFYVLKIQIGKPLSFVKREEKVFSLQCIQEGLNRIRKGIIDLKNKKCI